MTRATDEIRAPYARAADVVPRQGVFVGTSNQDEILKDMTGGRRFWPVTVEGRIDTDDLARDRDQLFAEAVAAFHTGEAWHLSPDLERLASEVQEASREEDPWEAPIQAYLDAQEFDGARCDAVRITDLLWKALEVPRGQHTSPQSRRVGGILRLLGWIKVHTKGGKVWHRQ